MARTLTGQETKVYAAGNCSTHLAVWIKDEGGTWVDLTDLEGRNWVVEVEIADDIDQPVMSATIVLEREHFQLSLAPLLSASKINNPGGVNEQRIFIGREVAILAAVLPLHQTEPASTDWRLLFHGDCDSLDVAAMRLQCVDLGGRLQRLRLERQGHPDPTSPGGGSEVSGALYLEEDETEDAEVILQEVLDDWAPDLTITLSVPSSPSWALTYKWATAIQHGSSVMDVLRSTAAMIGWECRYVYDATLTDPFGVTAAGGGVGGFALTLYAPDRANTTPHITLAASQYYAVSQMEDALATMANKVEVFYTDASSDPVAVRSVIAEDSGSQTTYGVLYMSVPPEQTTGIATEAVADDLAEAILADVVNPTAAMAVDATFLYQIELFDLIRFTANGVHFDSDQDLAVMGFRHRFADGKATTAIAMRGGTAVGHRGPWWQGGVDQTHNGGDLGSIRHPPGSGLATPGTPDITLVETINGFRLTMDAVPFDMYRVEWHLSTSAAFTPSSSTLVATGNASSLSLANLTQGTTYYVQAITINRRGVKSVASSEVSGTPGKLFLASISEGLSGPLFASGEDGDFDFDGTNTYSGYVTTTGSAPNLVYFLARDLDADSITVRTGKTVRSSGYRIHCLTLTLEGTAVIHNDGADGGDSTGQSGGTKQGPTTFGTLGFGADGGNGGNGSNVGVNGATQGTAGTSQTVSKGGAGAAGGAGGTATSPGAGGGSASTVAAPKTVTRTLTHLSLMADFLSGTLTAMKGGAGGAGGGGGGYTSAGGGIVGGGGGSGGSGGGVLFISALAIVLSTWTGRISANGGIGGDGYNTGNAAGDGGGGGGGGGGWARIVYGSVTGGTLVSGTNVLADGGAGGTANSPAVAGSTGSDGTVDLVDLGS